VETRQSLPSEFTLYWWQPTVFELRYLPEEKISKQGGRLDTHTHTTATVQETSKKSSLRTLPTQVVIQKKLYFYSLKPGSLHSLTTTSPRSNNCKKGSLRILHADRNPEKALLLQSEAGKPNTTLHQRILLRLTTQPWPTNRTKQQGSTLPKSTTQETSQLKPTAPSGLYSRQQKSYSTPRGRGR